MKDYKKILEGLVNIINNTEKSDIGFANICTFIGENCPELKEYEDERIRKVLIGWINLEPSTSFNDTFDGFSKEQILTWLEKQEDKDSQVKLPTFTFDDILALQCCMETVKKVQEDKDLYEKLNDLHGRVYDAYHLEKQGEQKSFDYENANIPQKDSTWGEEDKHWMQKVIDFMNHPDLIKATPTLAKDTINWLKSLKDRYAWKSSDEQMKVCKEVYADLLSAKGFDVGTINSELNRLEEKLK